ncbi:MAG: TIGR03960 family B12-binding radical SAM protein [Oscillospiraceae bacterium]|nr:TIGR03960 family B12-binding radical SAM protein [Oscillospiraceae bacterium]
MSHPLDLLLSRVQKPARYVGGEVGAVSLGTAPELRAAFCFPDTYEIGMSHLGLQILYGRMNQPAWMRCERAFAPWPDMEALLREHRLPLTALESGDALSAFDLLAFTLQYELSYSNVLNMLDLGGVPVRSAERGGPWPLIVAGGPCALNPEPLADFIDIFAVGDGEDVILELTALLREAKREQWDKPAILRAAARIEGLYVPALYTPAYRPDGTLEALTPSEGAPETVRRRVVSDLDQAFYPTHPVVPNTAVVHERVMLELFRGCIRGCRFCQAGHVTRPVRARSPETLARQGIEALQNTGFEEIALTSLSSSDYPELPALCDALLDYCEPRRVGLSLPSLRADSFSRELMERVQRVRKSGLTFAPEAGTPRLRDVINKNLTEADLMNACAAAFGGGWTAVKLYFMLGLPTETGEDVTAIAELAHRVFLLWRRTTPDKTRGVRVSASVSLFVPKPHTPFQWAAMESGGEFRRRIDLLKAACRKQITLNWHDPDTSYWEAVLARGDRRAGGAIYRAWQSGARLDGWGEHFRPALWQAAFEAEGLDPDFYALRERGPDEVLPWGHIDTGVSRAFLRREYEKALRGETTPDCRTQCAGCGASQYGGECGVERHA